LLIVPRALPTGPAVILCDIFSLLSHCTFLSEVGFLSIRLIQQLPSMDISSNNLW
jgi:hypothetical protein